MMMSAMNVWSCLMGRTYTDEKNVQKWVADKPVMQGQIRPGRPDYETWISSSTFVALYTLIERTKSSFSRGNRGSGGALMLPEPARGRA
jgi:hypothetical protein